MPLFFLGTREWRNRQTRTVQVRVPVMEWGFNSPLAHEEAADPFGICGFCFPWLLLVVPRVFRAPRGLSRGPGCLMHPWAVARPRDRHTRAALGVVDLEARPGPAATHRHRGQALLPLRRPPHQWGRAAPWAAARPLAVRAASFARRVALKPGQAPPPPTGTAARPRHRPSISHVIPLRLVQTLNLRRWNCNVFGVSRKMTAINYVRNMGGGDVLAPVGTTARPRASKRSLSSVSHAIP